DVSGKIVCPGLIDLHAHVFINAHDMGPETDRRCAASGVTTLVDAGSTGSATFPGLRHYVAERSQVRLRCFVHLSALGLIHLQVGELMNLAYADPEGCARTISENRDLANGRMHFTFPFVRKALDAGFMPDTIATDLTLPSATRGPVFDLPTTMSKFLNLGVSLDEIIRRVTTNPARVLGEDGRLGTLKPGAVADVAVFSLERGQFDFIDTDQNHLTGAQKLVTQLTLKDGRIWYRAPH